MALQDDLEVDIRHGKRTIRGTREMFLFGLLNLRLRARVLCLPGKRYFFNCRVLVVTVCCSRFG